MRKLHAALLAAGGLALSAGAVGAQASAPPRLDPTNVARADPFAELERISAIMRIRHEAMMRQMAAMQQRMQQQAAEQGRVAQPGQVVVSSNLPAGSYSYTVVSTTSGNGCTQTVRWSSGGAGAEPRVTRTSAGDCGAAAKPAPVVPVAAPAEPVAPAVPTEVLKRQARLPAATT